MAGIPFSRCDVNLDFIESFYNSFFLSLSTNIQGFIKDLSQN